MHELLEIRLSDDMPACSSFPIPHHDLDTKNPAVAGCGSENTFLLSRNFNGGSESHALSFAIFKAKITIAAQSIILDIQRSGLASPPTFFVLIESLHCSPDLRR